MGRHLLIILHLFCSATLKDFQEVLFLPCFTTTEDHEWGLLHEESPKNQPLFLYPSVMSLFNHTATFRQQSTYPLTTQYVISESYLLKRPRFVLYPLTTQYVISESYLLKPPRFVIIMLHTFFQNSHCWIFPGSNKSIHPKYVQQSAESV